MEKVWRVAVLAGAVFGLSAATVPQASAQFVPRARPLHGSAGLRAGFMPDPHVMSGSLGGPVRANQVNSSCRGYISGPPSHVISSRTGFRMLRFVVNAQADSTLMVMLPNGQILCNDDGGLRMNPLIETGVRRGEIRIWVGSYSQNNVGQPYAIGITELSHVTADNIGGRGGPPVVQARPPAAGIMAQAGALFGQARLRAGFMPDPHVMSGTAGGPVAGNSVDPSCRGHYSPQPSHVLFAQSRFNNIRFVVNAGSDTTLMVMLPSGQILCDDDGGSGMNPLVQTRSGAGPIRVWVGTYSSSRSAVPYNIGFSELPSVGTRNIPAPGGRGGAVVRPVQPVAPVGPVAEIVEMTVSIPVTLIGPGMSANTVALWAPRGGQPTQVSLTGGNIRAGRVTLGAIPPSLQDPVITVTQRRNGSLLVRAEQPPAGRGDRGQQFLLLVRWQGRPVVTERWSGTATQRGPRWSR